MKVVLELTNVPNKGDILICDENGVKSVSKSIFLSELTRECLNLKEEIRLLKEENKQIIAINNINFLFLLNSESCLIFCDSNQ